MVKELPSSPYPHSPLGSHLAHTRILQMRIHHLHLQTPVAPFLSCFSPCRPLPPFGTLWPVACGPKCPWFSSDFPGFPFPCSFSGPPFSTPETLRFLSVQPGPLAGCACILLGRAHTLSLAKTVIGMLIKPNAGHQRSPLPLVSDAHIHMPVRHTCLRI